MDWLNKWMCNSRIVSLALISHWIWVLYLQLPPGHVCIAIKAYVWHHAPRESPNFETNFLVTFPFFVTSSFVDTFFHLISKYSQTESWCTSELGAALSELWDRHIHKSLQTKRLCRIECYVRVYMCTLNCVQLWNTVDYSPPGSPVHRISQARIPEWVAISSSRGSSWPRDQTRVSCVSCIGRWIIYHWAPWVLMRQVTNGSSGVLVMFYFFMINRST